MTHTLRIQRPCDRRWSDLEGNDLRRFCADCGKFVYNLNALDRSEIEELQHQPGGLCATFVGATFAMPPPSEIPRKRMAATVLVSVLCGCSAGEAPPTRPPARTEKPALSATAPSNCEKTVAPEKYARLVSEEQGELEEQLRSLGYVGPGKE